MVYRPHTFGYDTQKTTHTFWWSWVYLHAVVSLLIDVVFMFIFVILFISFPKISRVLCVKVTNRMLLMVMAGQSAALPATAQVVFHPLGGFSPPG